MDLVRNNRPVYIMKKDPSLGNPTAVGNELNDHLSCLHLDNNSSYSRKDFPDESWKKNAI